jgi:cleavage and polyadenylation specificity factor subunit 3
MEVIDIHGDDLTIMPLGAGNEVGRSCVILKFKGKTVMFDCGIHPAKTGQLALPWFDVIDLGKVDLLLLTHFHLDHCGALPYLLTKTHFRGLTWMTEPTKAITKLLLSDYVKVANMGSETERIYSPHELNRALDKVKLLDYHADQESNGIKFKCYNAGHVLGAAMFLVEIAGVSILYTGDYSREEDRHL